MNEQRPEVPKIQRDLDETAKLYGAACDLAAGLASNGALSDFTTGGTVSDLSDIINLALGAHLREISTDVQSYAHMLVDAERTPPKSDSTVALLGYLKAHVGYFTHGDDAMVGWAFKEEVEKWKHTLQMAVDPGGKGSVDTGETCQEVPCAGTYRISIDREEPVPYDLALTALRGKDARCSIEGSHVILVEMLPQVRRWMATS